MRWSKLTLIRALFISLVAGGAVASCAQGSTDLGDYVSGTGGVGSVTVTTGAGGTTSSSASTSSSTTSGFSSSSSSTSTGSSTTSSSTSSSSGSPSSKCDMGSCSSCVSCAQGSVCFVENFACGFNCDCANIIGCIQANHCQTDACVNDCVNLYPAGESDFDALNQCLNCACVQACQVPAGICP